MLKYISKKTKNVIKSNKGFTLIEVMMAISILTIGILGVASLQITAMRDNSMSMDYTESTEKVQDLIEKLYSKNYSDDELKDTHEDGTDGLNDATELTADHYVRSGEYDVYWNIADNTARNSAGWRTAYGVKTIRVIIRWNDKGHPRMYRFDLLRSRV